MEGDYDEAAALQGAQASILADLLGTAAPPLSLNSPPAPDAQDLDRAEAALRGAEASILADLVTIGRPAPSAATEPNDGAAPAPNTADSDAGVGTQAGGGHPASNSQDESKSSTCWGSDGGGDGGGEADASALASRLRTRTSSSNNGARPQSGVGQVDNGQSEGDEDEDVLTDLQGMADSYESEDEDGGIAMLATSRNSGVAGMLQAVSTAAGAGPSRKQSMFRPNLYEFEAL